MKSGATATVTEIARLAGVSPATVSRVLNHQGIVKGGTYDRVVSALRELEYPFHEEALSSEDGGLILMNLPSFDNPFYSEIVAGAKTSASRHGCHLLVNEEHINRSSLPRLVQLLHKSRAAGLITLNHIPTDILHKLSNMIPLVQCCEFDQELDLPYVSIDDFAASKHVTEYMLSLGCKRVAFISGPPRYKYARLRMQGYQEALRSRGIPDDPRYIVQLSEVRYDLAISSAMQLLTMSEPPDAFVTTSDVYAMAAIRAAYLAGKRVPQDVMVAGFDNIEFSSMIIPSITTVSQPESQIGFMACELLLEKIASPAIANKKILLETEFIIRESTSTAQPG